MVAKFILSKILLVAIASADTTLFQLDLFQPSILLDEEIPLDRDLTNQDLPKRFPTEIIFGEFNVIAGENGRTLRLETELTQNNFRYAQASFYVVHKLITYEAIKIDFEFQLSNLTNFRVNEGLRLFVEPGNADRSLDLTPLSTAPNSPWRITGIFSERDIELNQQPFTLNPSEKNTISYEFDPRKGTAAISLNGDRREYPNLFGPEGIDSFYSLYNFRPSNVFGRIRLNYSGPQETPCDISAFRVTGTGQAIPLLAPSDSDLTDNSDAVSIPLSPIPASNWYVQHSPDLKAWETISGVVPADYSLFLSKSATLRGYFRLNPTP